MGALCKLPFSSPLLAAVGGINSSCAAGVLGGGDSSEAALAAVELGDGIGQIACGKVRPWGEDQFGGGSGAIAGGQSSPPNGRRG